jgi:hypothetical protein
MTSKTKTTTKHICLLFSLIALLFSCDQEGQDQYGTLSIDEISSVYYAEEPFSLHVQSERLSKIIWQISDGSEYEGSEIQHMFQESGTYQIKITGFRSNQAIDSTSYFVDVKYRDRSVQLKKNFYAIRAKVLNSNAIIVEGIFEGENITKFMKFDLNLNYSGFSEGTDPIDNDIFDNIRLGDEVFSLGNINNIVNENLLKSSDENLIPDVFYRQEILKYASGVIHYHHDNQSNLLVDFYNSDFTKLWTKTFSGINKAREKFIFNNQDKLFYLSFDANGDKIFIEKFKNVSLYYKSKTYELGVDAIDREILFAVYKPYSNIIDLAVYSHKTGSTYFFSINENCELIRKGKTETYLHGRITYTLTDGSVFVKQENKLIKFDNNWNLLSEINIDANYFDMFQLGDNQYLVCESQSNSLRLSYVDKHLNEVIFE